MVRWNPIQPATFDSQQASAGDFIMADGSGSSGILGVIVGAILVIGIGFFFFSGGFGGGSKSVDVNIKSPATSTK